MKAEGGNEGRPARSPRRRRVRRRADCPSAASPPPLLPSELASEGPPGERVPARRLNVMATVFVIELRRLLRDRRALFSALILPIALYPLIFLGQNWVADASRRSLSEREIHVVADFSAAGSQLERRLFEALAETAPVRVDPLDPGALRILDSSIDTDPELVARTVRELYGREGDLLVYAGPHPGSEARTLLRIFYDASRGISGEARARVERALSEVGRELRARRVETTLGHDPAAGLEPETIDVASLESTSGAALGRLLPLLAVLVILSGGSYAALSIFASERESGTLETLLVQPVAATSIVWGKFAAVLATGVATLIGNAGSVLACLALGLGSLPGTTDGGSIVIDGGRVALGALAFLPAVLLLCAVLCLVCGRARSFREGQHYLVPLMLCALVPTLLASQPGIELDLLVAAIPLAGPAVALRDALRAEIAWLPTLVTAGLHVGYGALIVTRSAQVFDAERLLQTADSDEESKERHIDSRRALRWGLVGVGLVYFAGGWLQARSPIAGLALTLWLLLPLMSFLCARSLARKAGIPWYRALNLNRPSLAHCLGAVACVPALALLNRELIALQERFLPLPSSVREAGSGFLEDLPRAGVLLLVVLSPAITEELFFRGAVTFGQARDLSARKVIVWQALLFGAVHASIYRFLPTALAGGVLCAVCLRSRSVLPAILAHATYNGMLVLGGDYPELADPRLAWLSLGAALLWLPRRASGSRE